MEKESRFSEPEPEEFRIINGVKCRRVNSGYTVRQYFSHFTEGVGPGGGWDAFNSPVGREQIVREYLPDVDPRDAWKIQPQDLPNTPYYRWEPIEVDK